MSVTTENSAGATAIRPFTIPEVPDAELEALRARIAATRWPDQETVTDDSQGVPLAMLQELTRYWAEDYDWRKCEVKLNAVPHFMTEIDGLDIHFIHVRSQHEDALPLIVTHGWPGSIIEQLKIIDPLINPVAHGAAASDAFHLVIPSLPGYGFSAKPTTTGWDPARIAGDLTRNDVLDSITLYWRTNTAVSSARLYWENKLSLYNAVSVCVPAAVSAFPGENYQAPRSWTERAYHNLIYYNKPGKGGHFAAWEQPQLFSAEVRAGLRPLRT